MKYSIIIILLFIFPIFCSAASKNLKNSDDLLKTVAGSTGAGYKTTIDAYAVIGIVLRVLFSLLGIFFLGLMIYGGFLWMTDRGSSQQVEKAKKLMTAAIIGMVIVLSSYAISYFVLNAISATTLKT
jgi:hypothetical protein